jgi:uncharacterized protein
MRNYVVVEVCSMKNATITLSIVCLALIAALVAVTLTGSNTQVGQLSLVQERAHVLTVSDSAKISMAPDVARANLDVITTKGTAKLAQDANANIAKTVRASLSDADKVETLRFNLYPKYEWDSVQRKQIPAGYEARHTLLLEVEDPATLGGFLDKATKAGVNEINGVSFGLSDSLAETARSNALAKATKKARDKAERMAAASGVTLGDLVDIRESGGYITPYQPRYDMMAATMAMESAPTSITPGDIDVKVTVTLVYEISQ